MKKKWINEGIINVDFGISSWGDQEQNDVIN